MGVEEKMLTSCTPQRRMLRRLLGICALLSLAPPPRSAEGAELRLTLPALTRLLKETVFTQNGRRYVSGDAGSACYAFFESPAIQIAGPRLVLTAHFSSKTGFEVLGNCVGAGIAENVSVSGIP